jgi:hypothetical protein
MKTWLLPLLLVVFACQYASSAAITTSRVPNGMIKTDYSAIIQASGDCTPYKWAIVSGPLPAGVNAKVSSTTTTLKLTGMPTTAATHSFVVQVTGCGGAVSRASYKVVIQAKANHVVDLKWKAPRSSNIVGYNAYRSPDGATWKRVNASQIASTLYSDSTVANNTTYYYATTAVDVNGRESRKSAAFKAVVP